MIHRIHGEFEVKNCGNPGFLAWKETDNEHEDKYEIKKVGGDGCNYHNQVKVVGLDE